MEWILIGVAAISILMARRQAIEVRDGIYGDRRAGVITEDAFLGGMFFGIGVVSIVIALLLWGSIL
jgi:hypothetical protein